MSFFKRNTVDPNNKPKPIMSSIFASSQQTTVEPHKFNLSAYRQHTVDPPKKPQSPSSAIVDSAILLDKNVVELSQNSGESRNITDEMKRKADNYGDKDRALDNIRAGIEKCFDAIKKCDENINNITEALVSIERNVSNPTDIMRNSIANIRRGINDVSADIGRCTAFEFQIKECVNSSLNTQLVLEQSREYIEEISQVIPVYIGNIEKIKTSSRTLIEQAKLLVKTMEPVETRKIQFTPTAKEFVPKNKDGWVNNSVPVYPHTPVYPPREPNPMYVETPGEVLDNHKSYVNDMLAMRRNNLPEFTPFAYARPMDTTYGNAPHAPDELPICATNTGPIEDINDILPKSTNTERNRRKKHRKHKNKSTNTDSFQIEEPTDAME
jgi:hypothetical protein